MYRAQAYVGLHENFMVKAHLLIPEGYENTLYSWIMNFQAVDAEYTKKYENSLLLDEGDIYVFADPDYVPAEYKDLGGAAIFDAEHNAACILGVRYFGEFKKGTLTLAWTIAERNGYASCHGGQKCFKFADGSEKVVGVFGLSGSGKSTITLSDHGGKMDFTVLHDDAFIISTEDGSSICLEQSYFDKTADYPLTNPQSKYFVTVQNCGVTRDANGKLQLVTEDIRNGNGRTVKSRFAATNREYRFGKSIDAIFWIMKDASLPPIVKVKSPELASVMGATLSTKRTSAEYRPGEDPNALVIVPYANPFRLYPLAHDYNKFKFLFEKKGTDCYIINTGSFLQKKDNGFYEKKISKDITLNIVEMIAKGEAKFQQFGPFNTLEYMPIEGYLPEFGDKNYLEQVKNRMLDRLGYVDKLEGMEKLPDEALEAIKNTANQNQIIVLNFIKLVEIK